MGVILLIVSLSLISLLGRGFISKPPENILGEAKLESSISPCGDYGTPCVSSENVLASSDDFHSPISIHNDTELAAIASNGTGTSRDPYILNQWIINASTATGIYITGTTQYFIIRDCRIEGTSRSFCGITLNQIASNTAHLVNNTCINNLYGIYLEYSDSVTVFNNTCLDNVYGIYLWYSNSSLILNNTCQNNWEGIYSWYSQRSQLINNTCFRDGINLVKSDFSSVMNNICSNGYCGIRLDRCVSTAVIGNICSNNTWGLRIRRSTNALIQNNTCFNDGLFLTETDAATLLSYIITDNTANDLPIGYFTNVNDKTITASYGQLILVNCYNLVIKNQYILNTEAGITLYHSLNCQIVNSVCINNTEFGIYLYYSGLAVITDSICNNNNYGIYLYHSSYSSITGNICSDNKGIGIYLHDSSGHTKIINNICNRNNDNGIRLMSSGSCAIVNNSCSHNYPYGIILSYASHSSIIRNACYNNSYDGIVLYETSYSIVANNTCCRNSHNGIYNERGSDTNDIFWNILLENYQYGIKVKEMSTNNQIYQNNCLNNSVELVSQAYDNSMNNMWEGNYWSDYNGSGNYSIAGSIRSNDTSPLLEPVDLELLLPLKEREIPLPPEPTYSSITTSLPSGHSSTDKSTSIINPTTTSITSNDHVSTSKESGGLQSNTPAFMLFTILLACFSVLLCKRKRIR